MAFSLGAEVLYQEVFTVSKLWHQRAQQHKLQNSGACGMCVARVNGMQQLCIWGCGMPWSYTKSLLVCGMPQGHEQVDESQARLRPLPEACCISYPLKHFCMGSNFLVVFLHHVICKLPEDVGLCGPSTATRLSRTRSWLIDGAAVACDMLPSTPHVDPLSLHANDVGLD